jgi:hypothetical protein
MAIFRLTAMVLVAGLVWAAVSQPAGEEVLRAPSREPLYKVDPNILLRRFDTAFRVRFG